jgi:pimeloyl-ACP methyl ester carboxylesterase
MDMGGQPALAFAASAPDRITALAVMNSLVLGDEATSWEIRVLRRFGWNRLALTHLPGVVFRRAERTFLPPGSRLPPELREELWRRFREPAARAFLVRMCAGYEGALPRLPELYARIRCRTLVLWGAEDRHFPPAHARGLQKLVPGSELRVLDGAHHWMVWHAAGEVASALGDFFAAA